MLNSSTLSKCSIISKGPASKICNELSNSISISSKNTWYLIGAVYVMYCIVLYMFVTLNQSQTPRQSKKDLEPTCAATIRKYQSWWNCSSLKSSSCKLSVTFGLVSCSRDTWRKNDLLCLLKSKVRGHDCADSIKCRSSCSFGGSVTLLQTPQHFYHYSC